MFEMMLCSGGSSDSTEVKPNITGSSVMLGKINRIFGTVFDANDVGYVYGGHDATYSAANDIFYVAANGDIIRATDIGLGSDAIRFPKGIGIGTKAYIFGSNGSNTFCVKVINFANKTSVTTHSGVAIGLTPTYQIAVDYNAELNKFFMKFRNSSVICVYSVDTNTFERLNVTPVLQGFTDNEYLMCGLNGIYTMGGWSGTTPSIKIHKVPYAGGAVVEHGALSSGIVASYSQGYCVHNRHMYYASWSNGRITIFIIDPEHLRELPGGYAIPNSTYRNIPTIGKMKNSIIYTGGTTIPVGSSGWQQDNRSNVSYQMMVDFDANPPYTPPAA